jgi:hypothetical protein
MLLRKNFAHNKIVEYFHICSIILVKAGILTLPLRQYPKLAQAFRQVVIKNKPVELDAESAFKLDSMGLVTLQGNDVTPRCDLYRYYFRAHLGN